MPEARISLRTDARCGYSGYPYRVLLDIKYGSIVYICLYAVLLYGCLYTYQMRLVPIRHMS